MHQLAADRTMVGTNATVFPDSFCCRAKARISSFLVMTGMVTCCCSAMVAAACAAPAVPEAGYSCCNEVKADQFKHGSM
jgi:hypothetical protein